jgi:predicted phage terminase large subunit-like protein
MTRFNNPQKGALILVMHRLAPDDLAATFTQQADLHISLPLIAEKLEKYTRLGKMLMLRKPGDVLNPARFSLAEAHALRDGMARHVWDGQYQQRPSVGGSGMLPIEEFRRYDARNPPKFELTIHSWDVGATIGGNASVCTKWGLFNDKKDGDLLYLLQVISLKLELPQVRAAIVSEDKKDKPAIIILDERGVGLGIYQDLRQSLGHILGSTATEEPIERERTPKSRPSASKIDRFGRAVLQIADGRILIPNDAPWLERFLNEVAAFPNISDKDQVDSMTQVVANLDSVTAYARRHSRNAG